MTTATVETPTGAAPLDLARGFLTGGVIGASLAAFVVGCTLGRVPLIIAGPALLAAYALLFRLAGAPRRAREGARAPLTALALIDGREVLRTGRETDVPVRFDLSVAPDGAPPFRIRFTQDVHVSELADHRAGAVLVVRYAPDRPWLLRIVKRPTPEWEDRAAGAVLEPAPGPVVVADRKDGCLWSLTTLLGVLLGAAAVVLLMRAELFGKDTDAPAARPVASSSTSTSTSTLTVTATVTSSATGTVTFGPGRSVLDRGVLREAVQSLTGGGDGKQALTVVVREQLLTVVFAPEGVSAPAFDPRSLPFDRVPALVEEARTTLGVDAPHTWQLSAERLAGALTIRIGVTGAGGSASLEADGQGVVVRRSPVR
ncbi:hypothetical protein SAMN05216371_0351 [Streptomyces sp. TLI_053]|uniref:hypothetical protein n=1 Tax=Streptomyces sp. TLI_053 TaxID=1855352 RepID=UPI00087BEC65|nr:hypothetical protein [Streptomyces sp. TLI_053]SDS65370.1 hypothetical protein SAMN05216371_0351 [Streptomyces sp. TLI_053]